MNTSLQGSQQGHSQQLQQIIQLKVQLTKCKSRLEGFKQIEQNYKKVSIKSQLMEKQYFQYQKIMETFFEKLKRLMTLLEIDYVGIFGSQNSNLQLKGQNGQVQGNSDSFSFVNMSPTSQENTSLNRKINKINSLRSIARQYLTGQQQSSDSKIQFKHEDAKFQLIQTKIKSLLRDNQQYRQTLSKYQRSTQNINHNQKQLELIVKRLQSQIRLKQKDIQQRDNQISQLLRRIQQQKQQLNSKEQQLLKSQKQQQSMIKTYEQLENKIQQIRVNSNLEQQHKNTVRNKCQQLLQELTVIDDQYLRNYLIRDKLVIMCGHKSNDYARGYIGSDIGKDWYSEAGGGNKNHKTSSIKDKYQFIFD